MFRRNGNKQRRTCMLGKASFHSNNFGLERHMVGRIIKPMPAVPKEKNRTKKKELYEERFTRLLSPGIWSLGLFVKHHILLE